MAKISQANRPMRVDSSLGEDVLLLEGFSGTEGVSTPFGYTLDLLSENESIAAADVLRKPVWVTIKTPDGGERLIHGLGRSFAQLGQAEGLTSYRAEIVPWLWFLSLSSDCKIFQNLSVPEIVEQVFQGLGYADFQLKLVKDHPKRLFCVQFRETHLNFVSRLLEEEGIFYFFEHSKSKHMLTLADDNSAVKPCPGQAKARMAADVGRWQEEDVVTTCECEAAVHTGKVTLRDYDPQQPSLNLESSVSGPQPEEAYHYPGNYVALDDGERLARLQLEAEEAREQTVRGAGTCRTFQSGYRFELKEHYRKDANQPYMLLEIRHWGRAGDYRSWESAPLDYRNDFLAIPFSVPYRPLRTTHKPRIWGTQTAVVVGKSGEEIWTDKDGRVKVQFYWDRLGKKDENSSCWVRVSSLWAGKNWGAIHIPRLGQEVVVGFLDGDPDYPVIIGRLYNSEQVPPYGLPGSQTQSGIKSRSSKGGGSDNFNEIRFEDKKGGEEVYIHAEKNKREVVEHDNTESVGHNERVGVANDQVLSVGSNRSKTVGKNESTSIGGSRTETVDKDESITVSGNRSKTVEKDESVSITKNQTIEVGEDRTEQIGKKEEVSIAEDRTHNIGKNDSLSVAKKLVIDVGDEITIKTGDASVTMKKNGDIQIKGKDIKMSGSGKIVIKADSDVNIKGSKVTNN
jgi:type VI secretion system secreted protein VgrG